MTPILEKPDSDFICVNDITDLHLIVAKIKGFPTILGKSSESRSGYSFLMLSNHVSTGGSIITSGHGYPMGDYHDTPGEIVRKAMAKGHEVAVFEKNQWKDALKWLISN